MKSNCHYWELTCISAIAAPPNTFVYTLVDSDGGRRVERDRVYAFGLRREQLFNCDTHEAIRECKCGAFNDPALAGTSVAALLPDWPNGDPLTLVSPEDCANVEIIGLYTEPEKPSDQEITWADARLTAKPRNERPPTVAAVNGLG